MEKPIAPEYAAPAISDYGDLQDLTEANAKGSTTDVPLGTPGPNVFT